MRDAIFAWYENNVMGTELGKYAVSRWISNTLYDVFYRW